MTTLAFVASKVSSPEPKWLYTGAALAVLGGAAVLFSLDPASDSFFPRCPFYALTGHHYPGCGTLRGLHQLLRGDLPAALGLNPLMVASLPFVAYSGLSRVAGDLRGRRLPRIYVPSIWIWTLLGVIVCFWVIRNIPAYPFSMLAL